MLAMSFSRISVEDAMLRARFGQEWEDWARRVPYKLVPYIW
jgi:protein-S-isoprenylcysteine O-methyltransferase Ste14